MKKQLLLLITVLFTIASIAQQKAPGNLVCYYKFNEDSGTLVHDEIANAHGSFVG